MSARASAQSHGTAPVDVHAVALWPGAGSASDHPSLMAIEEHLAPLPVARFDFPYRREGRRAPDRANKLIASLRADVAELCERLATTPQHVVLGGRSMGGRMCSMAVAGWTGATARGAETREEPLPAAGLILLGYPLHPPGRPERMRTEHLADVTVPTLMIQGDRDPFGTPPEMESARGLIHGEVTTMTIPGARHELKGCDDLIVEQIRTWLSRATPAG